MGALAVGALFVGQLRLGRGYIRKLRIGELEVDRLLIRNTDPVFEPEPVDNPIIHVNTPVKRKKKSKKD